MELYHDTAQDSSGNIINGASVTVTVHSTGLPATIYDKDGGALSNPFLSGYDRSAGEIDFAAADGLYDVQIVSGSTTTLKSISLVDGDAVFTQAAADLLYQAKDATLTALAGVLTSSNKIPYATATDTAGELDLNNSDSTLSGDSDTTVPSEKRIKAYVDSRAALVDKSHWPTIANNGTDANNDIDFSSGTIIDTSATYAMTLSAMTKQLDAAWAAGTNAGGLFSGTKASTTTYHCFIIRKDSDGSIDAGFDTSVTAANIPTGYTAYRRVGSIRTDGSSNIIAFTQSRDRFYLGTPILDFNTTNPGTSAVTPALTIPTGVNMIAMINMFMDPGTGAPVYGLVSSPFTVATPATAVAPLSNFTVIQSGDREAKYFEIETNTSAQIRYMLDSSAADTIVRGATLGWIDNRE